MWRIFGYSNIFCQNYLFVSYLYHFLIRIYSDIHSYLFLIRIYSDINSYCFLIQIYSDIHSYCFFRYEYIRIFVRIEISYSSHYALNVSVTEISHKTQRLQQKMDSCHYMVHHPWAKGIPLTKISTLSWQCYINYLVETICCNCGWVIKAG